MIELVYSNNTELLLDDLANNLCKWRGKGAHLLDPVKLVTPNRNMETWVRLGLAQSSGIAANLHFSRLERFIGEIVSEVCPGNLKLVDLDVVEAAVLAVLLDDQMLSQKDLQPVRRYLQSTTGTDQAGRQAFDGRLASDGADIRRVQLASRIAYLFMEYTYSRPEMISAWRDTGPGYGSADNPFADPAAADPALAPTAAWQRALWRTIFEKDGILETNPPAEGGYWSTLDQLVLSDSLFDIINKKGLPPVHIFGVSYVARIFQHLFARLGESCTLRIYTLNPCAEFWEDVETDREFFHRLDRELDRRSRSLWAGSGETDDDDPFGLFDADTPALRYWGRPGREHVRLLGELTDCDFHSAFSDPMQNGGGLLHILQQDILKREPERNINLQTESSKPETGNAGPTANGICLPDETIKLVAAPSVRREVEWVADQIWRLMRDDRPRGDRMPLRFSDIAVIVNTAGRDQYLPQIETVFASCHNLPSSVSDLPATAGSRVIEAMSLLLELPFGRFTRAEMLALMSHPAVIGRFDDMTPGDLADRAESLGIIFGADHSDHAGTYIDEDVFNWDQGIRRIALGTFMTGDKSGDERIFETKEGGWLVEEVSATAADSAARFGLLARSLLADARFVREQQMTLTDWARFYTAQIDAYLHLEDGADELDRLRLIRSLAKLEAMDSGFEVSGRVAAEIAGRSIESLGGGRGQYLAEGVVVSSFLPMRAIPFKVVFVLGLGEGLFPASGQRDALDLRSARRRAGDVDTSERDRYMFLETFLCTREKLYLSYVRRDDQTGDPLQPSAVVQELLHILEHGYLGREGIKELFTEPPLRRFDDPAVFEQTFIDEARAEAKVQEIARDWQAHTYPKTGDWPDATLSIPAGSGNELDKIRHTVTMEDWEKLSVMLALPGDPPETSSVTTTTRGSEPEEKDSIEAPIAISISMIRRFLECPMQGWASSLLGLTETEEDLADREEEDFEVSRPVETGLLREVFLTAAVSNSTPEEIYNERSARMRLAGQLPVGTLGQVIKKRHLDIIAGWQSLKSNHFSDDQIGTGNSTGPVLLERTRIGHSGWQCSTERVLDPLSLNTELTGPEQQKRVVQVRFSGLTEALFGNRMVSVTFQPRKPPAVKSGNSLGSIFRIFLRGIVDQTLLSALNIYPVGERQILVCYSGGTSKTEMLKMRLRPPDPEQARSWLATVSADLLGGTHAYLMPCEAVFLDYCDQLNAYNAGKKTKRGSLLPEPADVDIGSLLDGENIRFHVKSLAENERSIFSSLWGPVPSPRLYEPPPEEEAARIAARRFGPLFGDIISLEVVR